MSQKRPNGSKASQKGVENTKWFAFFNKFVVFSTLLLLFSRIGFYLAPIASYIGSHGLLLAPIAFYLLLLPPIVSYCLLAAPIVSYWLLMAPLGSYWLLLLILPPIGSYWFPFAPIGSYWPCTFQKKKTRFPFIC